MKAFLKLVPLLPLVPALLAAELSLPQAHAAAPVPVISGPWVQIRKSPLFESPVENLTPVWGPALPIGTDFRVEKVYGRWLYGTPAPIPKMKPKDYAKPGWVFSRMLLVPGDDDTLSPALLQAGRAVLFHGRAAWQKLGLGKAPLFSSLDFFEGLTLSQGTMAAFRKQDEAPLAWLKQLPLFFRHFFRLALMPTPREKKLRPRSLLPLWASPAPI